MIVVCNTSPITNLHAIGRLDLLKRLYKQLFIPPAVYEELAEGTRRGDHPSLESETDWIVVHPVASSPLLESLLTVLDLGEAQAIALALELNADLLLMDEQAGRKIAAAHSLRVTRVLGVLLDAKRQGLIRSVRPLLEQLLQTTRFRISRELYNELLRLAGEQ